MNEYTRSAHMADSDVVYVHEYSLRGRRHPNRREQNHAAAPLDEKVNSVPRFAFVVAASTYSAPVLRIALEFCIEMRQPDVN